MGLVAASHNMLVTLTLVYTAETLMMINSTQQNGMHGMHVRVGGHLGVHARELLTFTVACGTHSDSVCHSQVHIHTQIPLHTCSYTHTSHGQTQTQVHGYTITHTASIYEHHSTQGLSHIATQQLVLCAEADVRPLGPCGFSLLPTGTRMIGQ